MAGNSKPGPYINEVKKDDGLCVYVPTDSMGIGARPSGKPSEASTGPASLDHVGGSAGSRGKKK